MSTILTILSIIGIVINVVVVGLFSVVTVAVAIESGRKLARSLWAKLRVSFRQQAYLPAAEAATWEEYEKAALRWLRLSHEERLRTPLGTEHLNRVLAIEIEKVEDDLRGLFELLQKIQKNQAQVECHGFWMNRLVEQLDTTRWCAEIAKILLWKVFLKHPEDLLWVIEKVAAGRPPPIDTKPGLERDAPTGETEQGEYVDW